MAKRLGISPQTLRSKAKPDNFVGRRVFYEEDRISALAEQFRLFTCFVCDGYMKRKQDSEQYFYYRFRPVHKKCYMKKTQEDYDAYTSRFVDRENEWHKSVST